MVIIIVSFPVDNPRLEIKKPFKLIRKHAIILVPSSQANV